MDKKIYEKPELISYESLDSMTGKSSGMDLP